MIESRRKNLIVIITLIFTLAFGFYLSRNEENLGISVEIQTVLDMIAVEQTDYYIRNARYFQGLPHKSGLKPSYQVESWDDFLSIATNAPFEVSINQYKAPGGDGYQVIFDFGDKVESYGIGVEADSRTYIRLKNISTASTTL